MQHPPPGWAAMQYGQNTMMPPSMMMIPPLLPPHGPGGGECGDESFCVHCIRSVSLFSSEWDDEGTGRSHPAQIRFVGVSMFLERRWLRGSSDARQEIAVD